MPLTISLLSLPPLSRSFFDIISASLHLGLLDSSIRPLQFAIPRDDCGCGSQDSEGQAKKGGTGSRVCNTRDAFPSPSPYGGRHSILRPFPISFLIFTFSTFYFRLSLTFSLSSSASPPPAFSITPSLPTCDSDSSIGLSPFLCSLSRIYSLFLSIASREDFTTIAQRNRKGGKKNAVRRIRKGEWRRRGRRGNGT